MTTGILLPESTLMTDWFVILSAFVAINTVIYVTLALLKSLPQMHPRRWVQRPYRRAQTRSIYPDEPEDGRPRRDVQ